jgi:hypothetical protein
MSRSSFIDSEPPQELRKLASTRATEDHSLSELHIPNPLLTRA